MMGIASNPGHTRLRIPLYSGTHFPAHHRLCIEDRQPDMNNNPIGIYTHKTHIREFSEDRIHKGFVLLKEVLMRI
jgi:hypothetical protein